MGAGAGQGEMKLRFVESVYRRPPVYAEHNVQWYWVGHNTVYGTGYWRPGSTGQLTTERIFELLRTYL